MDVIWVKAISSISITLAWLWHGHGHWTVTLQWRRNEHNGVSNHQPHDCLVNCLFRCKSKKTSKRRVTGLGEGNPPLTDGFPSQRASYSENVSIWWRHNEVEACDILCRLKVLHFVLHFSNHAWYNTVLYWTTVYFIYSMTHNKMTRCSITNANCDSRIISEDFPSICP